MSDNREHNRQILANARRGDIIKIRRGYLYDHYVVYIGTERKIIRFWQKEPMVIHVNVDKGRSNGSVVKERFWDVVGEDKADINNSKDKSHKPSDVATILRRAKEACGPWKYDVLENNCEHFATSCRYGNEMSDQAYYPYAVKSGMMREFRNFLFA